MTIKATLELKTCQEHPQAVIIFAADFCPCCAAIEEKRELEEIIEEQEAELAKMGDEERLDKLEKEMVECLVQEREKGNGSEEITI